MKSFFVSIFFGLLLGACALIPGANQPAPADRTEALVAAATALPPHVEPAPTISPSNAAFGPLGAGAFKLLDLPGEGRSPVALTQLGEFIYVANRETNNLAVISGNQVQSFIPLGSGPTALAADTTQNVIFAATYETPTVYLIKDRNIQKQASIDGRVNALALDGNTLFVARDDQAIIERYDAAALTKQDELKLSQGSSISALVIDKPRNRLFAAVYEKLVAIDLTSFKELYTLSAPGLYSNFTVNPADGSVWAGAYDSASSRSYVVGYGTDGKQLAQVFGGEDLIAAAFDDANRLYILDHFNNQVRVIQAPQGQLLATISVNQAPGAAVFDAASHTVIVTNQENANLSVIDTRPLQVSSTIPLAADITALAANPVSNRVYAASGTTNSVFVIEGQTIVGQVQTGADPVDIAVDPTTSLVYVASHADGKLTVFDDKTLQVQASQYITSFLSTVAVDPQNARLFAGSYELDPKTLTTRTLFFAQGEPFDSQTFPESELVNPTLKKLYAVASNGIPGSNARDTLYTFDYSNLSKSNYLGSKNGGNITAMAVDTNTNQFYAANTHPLAYTHGLDVFDGQDNLVASLGLSAQTTSMVINPATFHLFLSHADTYQPFPVAAAPTDNQIEVLDTRSLGRVLLYSVADPWHMTLLQNNIYVASHSDSTITILSDIPAAQPPAPTATLTPTPYATVIAPKLATPNSTPSAAAPITPTEVVGVSCSYGPDQPFAQAWVGSESILGCPTGPSSTGQFAVQTFKDGYMFDDLRDPNAQKIYVLLPDNTFQVFPDTWHEGIPERPCQDVPIPEGRIHPKRGFGKVWCDNPNLQTALPGAVADEHSIELNVQPFEKGMMWANAPGGLIILFTDGTWKQSQ